MAKIEILDIVLPKWEDVRNGGPSQSLIVTFTVDGIKFRCTYIQEHYFYRGMPGICTELCSFQKIEKGEITSVINCDGEFRIPHEGKYVPSGYASNNYCGDDPRYLQADEAIVLQYLVAPFVNRYF